MATFRNLFIPVWCLLAATELTTTVFCRSLQKKQAATGFGAHISAHTIEGVKTHSYREAATGLILHDRIIKEDKVHQLQTHDVIFVIKQRNMDELTTILHDISDPDSVNYGKHMSALEIANLTRNPGSYSSVVKYLNASGASIVSETLHGEYITARASIQVWEQMFNTEFYTYALHPLESDSSAIKRFARAEEYSVPMVLDLHVTSVLNTVQMLQTQPRKPVEREGISTDSKASFNGAVYPATLNAAHNIDSNVGHPRATQAVFETINQSFSPSDLTAFQHRYGLPVIPVNKSIGGHARDSYCIKDGKYVCGEGSLDIQYITTISQSPTTYYYVEDWSFSDFLMLVANTTNPPLVISFSYGFAENYTSNSDLDAFNDQAIKLSAMGVTIVSASGDEGAPSTISHTAQCGHQPEFIGTSPYVLSVGATRVRS